MSRKKLYIVTEGSHDIGFGHIARCLSFYERFRVEGYDVTLLVDGEASCDRLLTGKKYEYLQWYENIKLLGFTEGSIIFLDSIRATQEQVDYLQSLTSYFVVIDDYQRRNYVHALIIDWTPNVEHSGKHSHNVNSGNTLLLGIDYSVLRQSFTEATNYNFRDFTCLTIIMGGSDIRNLTPLLANKLGEIESVGRIQVIIGPGTAVFSSVISNVFIYRSLDAAEMKKVFLASDLVLSAGGQTIFELASLGIPTIPIQVIDNQTEDLQGFLELGFYDEIYQWDDPELLEKVTAKIKTLFPVKNRKKYVTSFGRRQIGKGMDRIVRAIYKYCHESI